MFFILVIWVEVRTILVFVTESGFVKVFLTDVAPVAVAVSLGVSVLDAALCAD